MTSSVPVPSSAGVSARMRRQRRRDTAAEMKLRKELHRLGYRFRVNYPVPDRRRRTIDIAFTRRKVAVFVDGCFWHACPVHATWPRSNSGWWTEKLQSNAERDVDTASCLEAAGWRVVRIWEHSEVDEALALVVAALRAR